MFPVLLYHLGKMNMNFLPSWLKMLINYLLTEAPTHIANCSKA